MNEKIKKEFLSLEKFKGKNIEVYRSSAPQNTALHFTEDRNGKQNLPDAYFELLCFDYFDTKFQYYLKYPNTDYFIELTSGGESSHGKMKNIKLKNIWGEDYNKNITFYKHEPDVLLLLGELGTSFNFLKMTSKYKTKGEDLYNNEEESFINVEEIDKILKGKYLSIPNDLRSVSHLVKTEEIHPTYLIIDYPAYNMSYSNQRLRTIKNNKVSEHKIIDFKVYKDGGTTEVTYIHDNEEHVFFYPTPFKKEIKIFATINEQKAIDVEGDERYLIVNFLEIIEEKNK